MSSLKKRHVNSTKDFILDQQSTFLNDSSYRGFNYPTTTQRTRATDTQNGTSQKREADFCPDRSDDVRVGILLFVAQFSCYPLDYLWRGWACSSSAEDERIEGGVFDFSDSLFVF